MNILVEETDDINNYANHSLVFLSGGPLSLSEQPYPIPRIQSPPLGDRRTAAWLQQSRKGTIQGWKPQPLLNQKAGIIVDPCVPLPCPPSSLPLI